MTAEVLMIVSIAIFVAGGIVSFKIIARFNAELFAAIRKLELAYDSVGVVWLYRQDPVFRRRLHAATTSIFEASDLPEVQEAKREVLACWRRKTPIIWRAVAIMGGSMILCVGVTFVAALLIPTR